MKIVITGANGQLGHILADYFKNHEVVALTRRELDLTTEDLPLKLQSHGPDWVINTAAYTAVDRAESEPQEANHINHICVANLASACKSMNARLLHVSTDFVFDGKGITPYTVDAACTPLNTYGKSKHEGEQAVLRIHPDGSCIVRTAWLYSARGNNFVRTMLHLMQERDELGVVVDQVGTPTSTATLALFIRKLVEQNETGVFHWTDAGTASWYDFAVAINEEAVAAGILYKNISINPISTTEFPTAAKRPHYSVLDKSKSYARTLSRPVHWRTALREVIDKISKMENNIV